MPRFTVSAMTVPPIGMCNGDSQLALTCIPALHAVRTGRADADAGGAVERQPAAGTARGLVEAGSQVMAAAFDAVGELEGGLRIHRSTPVVTGGCAAAACARALALCSGGKVSKTTRPSMATVPSSQISMTWEPKLWLHGMRLTTGDECWVSFTTCSSHRRHAPSDCARGREVLEAGKVGPEGELHGAHRAHALLGHDDLGHARFLALVLRVVLVAVDEHDDVRVLLDGAGLAQVGHHRPLVGPLLHRAVELRQCDDRALQLLGQGLQAARDLAEHGGAVFFAAAAVAAHQLQVVDDDQAGLAADARLASRPGPHLARRQARALIDGDPRLAELVDGLCHA
mmetsp:Transcript_21794/g.85205  ORF Transcript_21794/g.85205 Transcript_21794/m.85205 type:complete len:341 (+) Transcript_21794:8620-9642(+)